MPLAIMDGTYITALRTGAAGATGIKYLSKEDSKVVGLCGLGVQGRSQLMGLMEASWRYDQTWKPSRFTISSLR